MEQSHPKNINPSAHAQSTLIKNTNIATNSATIPIDGSSPAKALFGAFQMESRQKLIALKVGVKRKNNV